MLSPAVFYLSHAQVQPPGYNLFQSFGTAAVCNDCQHQQCEIGPASVEQTNSDQDDYTLWLGPTDIRDNKQIHLQHPSTNK